MLARRPARENTGSSQGDNTGRREHLVRHLRHQATLMDGQTVQFLVKNCFSVFQTLPSTPRALTKPLSGHRAGCSTAFRLVGGQFAP